MRKPMFTDIRITPLSEASAPKHRRLSCYETSLPIVKRWLTDPWRRQTWVVRLQTSRSFKIGLVCSSPNRLFISTH